MKTLENVIPQLIAQIKHEIYARPLFLGGTSASGGGVGGPPGGFIGYLPQTRVAFDTTESASNIIPESGASLLDNLNRIRYRLQVLESGGGGISGDYVPVSGGEMYGDLIMDANIILSGIIVSPSDNGIIGNIAGVAGVYTEDWQFPLLYDVYNKLFLVDRDVNSTITYNPQPVIVSNGGIFSSGDSYSIFIHNNSEVVITVEFPDDYSHWDAFILQMLPKYYATSFKIEGRKSSDGNWYVISDVVEYDRPYYGIRVRDFYSGSTNWNGLRVTFREFYNSTYLGVMRFWWVSREGNVYFPQYLSVENGGRIYEDVILEGIEVNDIAEFNDDAIFNSKVDINNYFIIKSGNANGIIGENGSISFDGENIYFERDGDLVQLNQEDTDDVPEGTNNLYYTDERVSNNSDVAANTSHRNTISGNPHHVTAEEVDAIEGRGNGETNYLSKWSDANTLDKSGVYEDNSGNIGIGIISPTTKLDLNGNFRVRAGGNNNALYVDNYGHVGVGYWSNGAQLYINHTSNTGHYLRSYAENSGGGGVDQSLYRYTTSNGAYYSRGLSFTDEKAVASGVTDSGYINGFWGQAFARGTYFGKAHEGTLKYIFGGVIYTGIYNSSSTGVVQVIYGEQNVIYARGGTINTAYNLYLGTSYDSGVVNSLFAIYQADSNAKNYFSGNVGIGITTPTSKLDVNDDRIRIRSSFTPVSTSDSSGNIGDITWDNNYLYIKTNYGWKRAALFNF